MTWLMTGGAGSIAAFVERAMREAGEEVVVLDDLSGDHAERVSGCPGASPARLVSRSR